MKKDALAALFVLAMTNLGLGWYLGYRSLTAYIVFWLLCGFVLLASVRLARDAFDSTGLTDTIIRSAILAFALIVLSGFALGSTGLIGRMPYLTLGAGAVAATRLLPRGARPAVSARRLPIAIAVVLVPTLIFVIAVGMIQSPPTLYDSLSYHLFFPARWLQDHRISIIATPFSDEAQAYAPANGELFFLWLMVPFHGDLLARVGQLPFFLLGGVTIYALARRLGAKPAHAMYVPAFYFLSQRIVEQAVGADVDLICWAMFLTSLYVGIVAVDTNKRRDWLLWGISLGLYFGSKYVSLVYSPILLLLPLTGRLRVRIAWALPGLCVLALPWYVRNWIVGGSPLYPSSLSVAGVTIAQGAYSRAAMMHSVLHATALSRLPPMLGLAFGATMLLFWIPFAAIGAWRMLSMQPRRPNLFLLLAPIVMAVLYWYGVPDNLDCRFLLPVVMMALLPLAFAFRTSRTWNACVHTAFAAGLVWLVSAWHGDLPVTPLPWPTGNWLSLGGLVSRAYIWPFVGLAGMTAIILVWLSEKPARAVPALTALVGASALIFSVGSKTWCSPDVCRLLEISPTYIHEPMLDGWAWLTEHVAGATIVYTGNNLPYPLSGDHLANRVYYVNIDRHADWRFHDYDHAHRGHRPGPLPSSTLAVSSGLLEPLPDPLQWQVDAVRPRYERMEGDRDAWMHNLASLGVKYLFVSVLSAYEVNYVSHNDDGFPVEDDWARGDPTNFTVVYENRQVRIFAVRGR